MVWTERLGCTVGGGYESTSSVDPDDVTRIKSGTCEIIAGAYFSSHALGRTRTETPSHGNGRPSGFKRDIRGEGRRNQGLRHSLILVITPARTGEASRVLHPLRSCASECSANGRSATRSDSQRSNGRTRWDGHPAWGSKPRPHRALPSGVSANRWQVGEERRQ